MRKEENGKYSVISNICYALKNIWEWDRVFYFWFLPGIPLDVAVSLFVLYFPKQIIDGVEREVPMGELVQTILFYIALLFLADTCRRFCRRKLDSRRYWISNVYQVKIAEKYLRMDYANMENPKTREKYQAAINDAWGAASPESILESLFSFGKNTLGILSYGGILLTLSPIILLFLAISATVMYLYGQYQIRYQEDNRENWNKLDRKKDYIASFSHRFEYAKDIRLFHMTGWLDDKYRHLIKERFAWTRKLTFRSFMGGMVNSLLLMLQNLLAYWLLCEMLFQGSIGMGSFVFQFSVVTGFSAWLNGMVYGISGIVRQGVAIGYYREYFEITDHYNHGQGCPLPEGEGLPPEIEFDHVYYRYEGSDDYLFQDICFKIGKGKKLAIVGENGAGKTTLIKLICGFYFPEKGRVLINGIPTTEFNIEEYYTLFSVIFQDMYLLPVTIEEFVASAPAGEVDDRRLEQALDKAGLKDKVALLKEGIHSRLVKGVYDDAIDLSGGEQQKLMLARAVYRDAPVVILDEPTSALDPIAESRLYQEYNGLTTGKTGIYISHRLASTSFCDHVLLLEKGRIREEGTHEELLSRNGRYAQLFRLQSRYYRKEKAI